MNQPTTQHALTGAVLGFVAAVAYTLTNLALRKVAPGGDLDWAVWVQANKTLPAALIAWGLVAIRHVQGLPGLPPARLVMPLIGTGLVMQFGGNVLFQFALSRGGLALTVPLAFSTIIISSALGGRIALGEPILPRTALSMGVMTAAVIVLSGGADAASTALVSEPTAGHTLLAVLSAAGAGIGYGSCGVMIRRCVKDRLPVCSTVVLISSTGIVVLGLLSLARMGGERLLATPADEFGWMLTAGAFNALAFFSITAALRYLTVVKVNLINTSQAAMASLAGVMLFDEPATIWLILGSLLTAAGLMLLPDRSRPDAGQGTGGRGHGAGVRGAGGQETGA